MHMVSNKPHKPLVVCSALLGAMILFPSSAYSSTGNPARLGPFANDPYAEPVEWAQRHRDDDANRHKFTSRRREAHRRSERHRRSDRHRRREHNRERNHRYNQHYYNDYGGERHAPYGQSDRHYRSNLGINFFFGSSGYSTYRWASSPYSFIALAIGPIATTAPIHIVNVFT